MRIETRSQSFGPLRRAASLASVALAALALTAGEASADKLILFKNGKALRVKSAVKDGRWLKCEFEGRNFISVPASGVLGIEEAMDSGAGAARPNQVAAGVGGGFNPGPGGIGAAPLAPNVAPPQDEAYIQEEVQAALAEEAEARRRNPPPQLPPAGFGRRGSRIGGNAQPFQPNALGLQPLSQPANPFPNSRRLNQRGPITPRSNVPQPAQPVPDNPNLRDQQN